MIAFTLGLPAGYFGGRFDTVLSFIANLVLAFPVILLFYLLVTPGIMETAIPYAMAGVLFLFPIIFFCTLFYTRFRERPEKLYREPLLVAMVVACAILMTILLFVDLPSLQSLFAPTAPTRGGAALRPFHAMP